MYTERQAQILTAITQGLGLSGDTASDIRVVQSPGYIDSVIETHDFAAALMGAIGQAEATVGERRGLGGERLTTSLQPTRAAPGSPVYVELRHINRTDRGPTGSHHDIGTSSQ
jgi:hypothetical protein